MKRTLKMPLSRIIVAMGLFSFFRPTIFEKYFITNTFFNALLILSFSLCILDLFRRRNKFFDICTSLLIVFYMIMFISTVMNKGSYSRAFMYVLVGIGTIAFTKYVLRYEFAFATKMIRNMMWIYLILNIISCVVFPEGIAQTGKSMSAIYFLGQPTRYAYFYLPGLMFCYLEDEYKRKKVSKNTIILYILCLVTLVIQWSVGSTIALLFLLAFFCFHEWKVFNGILYYVVQLVGYFGLVYFSIQNIFASVIVIILKKDITLSSRTRIWQRALNLIEESPFIGIGIKDNQEMTDLLVFIHTHNHLLQVTLQCGYIGFLFFAFLILLVYLKLRQYKNFMPARVIEVFLFMVGVQLLVDTIDGVRNHYVMMLVLGASIKEIYHIFEKRGLK